MASVSNGVIDAVNETLAGNNTLNSNGETIGWQMEYSDTYKVLLVVIASVGITGNLFVCFVIGRVPALQTRTNLFVVNQAIVDFLSSVMLIMVNRLPEQAHYAASSFIDRLICRVWVSRYLMWSVFLASTYSLVGLTAERYLAIVYPLAYVARFTTRKAYIMIGLAWSCAFTWQSYAISRSLVIDGQCRKTRGSAEYSKLIGVFSFSVQYFIPLALMAFAYSHISAVLDPKKKPNPATPSQLTSSTTGPQSTDIHLGNSSIQRARRNVYKTFCLVFFAYAICWTPNQIHFLLHNFMVYRSVNFRVHEFTVLMAYCNSCINPVIYAIKYKQFRSGIRQAFGCPNGVNSMA